MRKKKPYLTLNQIEKALRKNKGYLSYAAEDLGVTPSAISHRVRRSQRLRDAIEDTKEKYLDLAENIVHDEMNKNRSLTASIFYLKYQGARRGYTKALQTELSTKDDKPLPVKVVIVESARDKDTGKT